MSLKYLSILVNHPAIAGTRLLVYFSGISNFNPLILASRNVVGADVAVASNEDLAGVAPTNPRE